MCKHCECVCFYVPATRGSGPEALEELKKEPGVGHVRRVPGEGREVSEAVEGGVLDALLLQEVGKEVHLDVAALRKHRRLRPPSRGVRASGGLVVSDRGGGRWGWCQKA